jgi:hypothetical protein
MALDAYICLNVARRCPDLWDKVTGERVNDYRRTAFYQRTLRCCTNSRLTSEIPAYPHQQFFGIVKGQFNFDIDHRDFHFGLKSIEEFLVEEKSVGHLPNTTDVVMVCFILQQKHLPMELVMDIMELAEYQPKRTLQVPHDPLHPDNKDELDKYLDYCWRVLVNCDMFAHTLKLNLYWKNAVTNNIVRQWGCKDSNEPTWYDCQAGCYVFQ